MRVLILGGTAFVGVHLTNDLLARGHEVWHFNRGQTGAAPAAVRTVIGDRTIGFAGLEDEPFDAVVDTSGYYPHVVELSVRFFEPRCSRYMFVSSISVFDHSIAESFEDSPVKPLPPDASLTEMTPETYGPLKTACERIVVDAFGERSTIVRPGLIVGPLDKTDRFTYWPVRFARGGEILAPGTPERQVQFVDVRDLAPFMVDLLEGHVGGDFNVTSPQGAFTMGAVMDACAKPGGAAHAVRWVGDEFLTAREVAPFMDLPLWIPPSENMPGFMNFNVRRAQNAGFAIRPLADTVRDTLAWAQTLPSDHEPRAGITPEREAELLNASG
jgi:2'-hydroxyisoflavone reductase